MILMAVVRVIDLLVMFVKLLGGRLNAPGAFRFAAWVAFLAMIAAGIALAAVGLILLYRWLETIPPTAAA